MARLRAGIMKVEEAPQKPRSGEQMIAAGERAARIFGGIFLVIGLAAAYFVWPTGITDVALGAMTLGQLLRVIGAGAIALATISLGAVFWS